MKAKFFLFLALIFFCCSVFSMPYATVYIFSNYIPNGFFWEGEAETNSKEPSRIFLQNLQTDQIRFIGAADMRSTSNTNHINRFILPPGNYRLIAVNWDNWFGTNKLQKVEVGLNAESNKNYYFHLWRDDKYKKLFLESVENANIHNYYVEQDLVKFKKAPKLYEFESTWNPYPQFIDRSAKTLDRFRFVRCRFVIAGYEENPQKVLQCHYNFLPDSVDNKHISSDLLNPQKFNSPECEGYLGHAQSDGVCAFED